MAPKTPMNPDSQPPSDPPRNEFDQVVGQNAPETSRRNFLSKSAPKVAYVAPLVLLFHPKGAIAASGVSNPGT